MIYQVHVLALTIGSLLLAGCTTTLQESKPDDLSMAKEDLTNQTEVPDQAKEVVSETEEIQATDTVTDLKTNEELPMSVTISTPKGEIVVKLYGDKAPNTVKNFIDKIQAGFYNGLTFHRVESWVIQGGDPDGNGTGGGTMTAEYNDVPFKIGSLGIARGMDKAINNDSQFFICTDACAWLTGEYTNFGEVTAGMEVAKTIAIGDKITKITVTE